MVKVAKILATLTIIFMAYCTIDDIKELLSEDEIIQLTDDRDILTTGVLSGAITSSSTLLILDSSTSFPPAGRIKIGNEEITYTGNSSNTLSGLTRGVNNTTATSHADDSAVTELHTIDTSITTRVIADADALIDAYCSAKYDVPFTTVPDLIRKYSVDISIYNLFARRKGPPDHYRDRWKDAKSFLSDIAKGLVQLGDTPIQQSDSGAEATTDVDDKIFTIGLSSDSSVGTLDNF